MCLHLKTNPDYFNQLTLKRRTKVCTQNCTGVTYRHFYTSDYRYFWLNIIGNDVKHVVKGEFRCGGQYHYTMETQTCVCVPVEDGMDIYPASQWMDLIQVAVAELLNIKNNR